MQLIPAIDLMNGKIVRLTRGEANTAKYYYHDFGTPLEAAKRWFNEGAQKLHIIDLDAAFGKGNNYSTIGEIALNFPVSPNNERTMPIQVGGGIRDIETAKKLKTMGISQVILGTVAITNEKLLVEIMNVLGSNSVIVSLDHEKGLVKSSHGWTKSGNLELGRRKKTIVKKRTVNEALRQFIDLGIQRFLITSIDRDGMLSGTDLETLENAARFSNIKIIAAGGIGSISDLIDLKRVGVEGVVIGKALYEHKFTLKEALKKLGD
jgi:phosphoribosylformimino-5-aminoimidazole carboxamide ribotide isomerase